MCKRFLIRPRPYENETWYGYLIRVTEKNGLDSFLQITNSYQSRKSLQAALMLHNEDLARLKGLSPNIYRVSKNGIKNLAYTYSLKHFRWCPTCMLEKEYHQVFWTLKFSCVCLKHQIKLHDKCPRCKKLQSLKRNTIGSCQYCGTALSSASQKKVSNRVINLQTAIHSAYHGVVSNNTFDLTYNDLNRFINYIGQFNDSSMPVKPGKYAGISELDYAFPLMDRTASFIERWPTQIQDLMKQIQAQSKVSLSIKGHFGSLYHVLYVLLRAPAFQFLRDVFEDHLIQHWPSLINERNKAFKASTVKSKTRLTVKQMASLTNAEPSMINYFIETKKITSHVVELKSGRKVKLIHIGKAKYISEMAERAMTLQHTARRMNISESRVRTLINEDKLILLVSKTEQNSAKWLIDSTCLKEFIYMTLPVENSCITIKQVFKSWKFTTNEFLMLLNQFRTNSLRTYSQEGGIKFLGDVWVKPIKVREWLSSYRKANNQILSVDEAAKRLGIKQQVAYHLVKKGMIESIKSTNGKIRIRIEAVNTFKKQYISLLDISKQMKTSPNQARKHIVETPVCGPTIDGCRQYFYLKKHFAI